MPTAANATARPHVNVMICNAESGTRQALRRWVGRLSAGEITEAETAGKAFEQLAQRASDLLLVDMDLPDIDGVRVLKMIRSTPALDELSVAVLSQLRSEELVRRALEAGVEDYILKPISFDTTMHRLSRLVQLTEAKLRQRERDRLPGPEPRQRPVILLAATTEDKEALSPPEDDPRWTFVACRSASEALINVQRRKPDITLLSHSPANLKLPVLAQKLRELSKPRDTRICFLTRDVRAGEVAPGVEALPRPEARKDVRELLGRLAHEYHAQGAEPGERVQGALRTRLRQALAVFFETYTGKTPALGEETPEYASMWAGGCVRVEAADSSFCFELWLAAERGALEAVAESMFEGESDEEDDEGMLLQVLLELLNSVAGATKTIAEELQVSLRLRLPEAGQGDDAPELDPSAERHGSLDWEGTGTWALWGALHAGSADASDDAAA